MATIAELIPQGGGWRDDDIAPGAGIAATKVIHQQTQNHLIVAETTDIASVNYPLCIVNAETAEIIDFDAAIFAAMTSTRTLTVDLHKSTGGGAFATIMSAPISMNSSNAARLAVSGVISNVDLVAGDILRAVVTVGGTGTLPKGLLVGLTIRERPIS